MANRNYLTNASSAETVLWMFVLAALVSLLTVVVRLWVGVVAAGISISGFVLLAIARADRGTVLDVVYPTLAVLVALLASAALREVLVDRQRRRISSLFAQYVPPRVARELVGDQRSSGLLDGQRLDVTVLFCDIRGFTPLTAPLSPPQIRELLDSYYSVLSRVVLDHTGTVLRYTGDEVLAAFGAPIESDDHAERAVRCAIAMHAARGALAAQLQQSGLPALDYGIGVQTGDVVSAVMGSAIRRQYAVIGTPLTLGSRLCSQARAGETVVSSETWNRLAGAPPSAEQFTAELKGRDEAAVLYRIAASDVRAG
jgi:adenylate cyclase